MEEQAIQTLATQVLWAGFALSVLLGALVQRTHFCTMGAVADIVSMGSWARMRMWVLAMGVAVLGFNAMVGLGWLQAANSIYAAPRLLWASHALGGLMFGVGMVLASGCGGKTLVRMGGGNLKSLVVFLVMGVAAYATLRGITGVLRVATVEQWALELGRGQDLPSLLAPALGREARALAPWLGGLLGGALVLWALARAEGRSREVLLGGVGVGAVIAAVWWVSGVMAFVPEHPQTLEPAFLGSSNTQRMEALSFVSPVAATLDWLMLYSDRSRGLNLGIVSVLGMVLGSALHALATRRFRWEGFRSTEDLRRHLVGALLMGVGGVVAMGCTIGQGLSGLSTLSLGSAITLVFIVAGAALTLRWEARRLERLL